MQHVGNRVRTRRSPEEVKKAKLEELRADIVKLRQKKAVLRLELQQQKSNARAAEYKARLDAIDQKVAEKLYQMRELAIGAARAVGRTLAAPGILAKRVWDDWQV